MAFVEWCTVEAVLRDAVVLPTYWFAYIFLAHAAYAVWTMEPDERRLPLTAKIGIGLLFMNVAYSVFFHTCVVPAG